MVEKGIVCVSFKSDLMLHEWISQRPIQRMDQTRLVFMWNSDCDGLLTWRWNKASGFCSSTPGTSGSGAFASGLAHECQQGGFLFWQSVLSTIDNRDRSQSWTLKFQRTCGLDLEAVLTCIIGAVVPMDLPCWKPLYDRGSRNSTTPRCWLLRRLASRFFQLSFVPSLLL